MENVEIVDPIEPGHGIWHSSCPCYSVTPFSATIADGGDLVCNRCAVFDCHCKECLPMSNADAFVIPYKKAELAVRKPDDDDGHVLGEPRWIGLQAFKESLAFTCLFTTCGWANFTRPWIIPALFEAPTSLSYICARALAIGILGLEEMHMESQIEATSLYGTALGMLANSISTASRKEAAHLLAPVMALTFYTVGYSSQFFTLG